MHACPKYMIITDLVTFHSEFRISKHTIPCKHKKIHFGVGFPLKKLRVAFCMKEE